ncbi:hypothetical protein RhiirA5_425159 [Rhizophagus irregularis]|uniref:Protein kinase domain-containing protein n=1 Tax=Rhizophagus irregularis TaxID=588596 RepID=A0A2N0P6P3_9GLOM|nr:hypothetical protein RhiirA5_425159 [Rhizophagus irregularis]
MDSFRIIKPSVINEKCKECGFICYAIRFQQNFKNWTSGNKGIDKFIQDIQLSEHIWRVVDPVNSLEWIPYDRLYDIKYMTKDEYGKVYRANWIDGNIKYWDDVNQNWKRNNLNMFVNLKSLNTPNNLTFEFANKIKIEHEIYGITQDPETKNYMMVLGNICKKCNLICYAKRFQQNFKNWTSGNKDIDKFIQDTQLTEHTWCNFDPVKALEWIPYDRLCDIKYITKNKFGKVYKANWIDGDISNWDDENKNWKRNNLNMFVSLKSLNNPKNVTIEFANKVKIYHRSYGITQNPETKNYMIVLDDRCDKCNCICNSVYFQRNFKNWTSGNNNVDSFIQDTQLSAHGDPKAALQWIPYNRFSDIKYIANDKFSKVYRANWIDGNISYWSDVNQNWISKGSNMFVNLKSLSTPNNLTLEYANKIKIEHEIYGMTQDPETKIYMMVLNNKCKKCNCICYTMRFQQNFENWASSNKGIDKFIQDTQLSAHEDVKKALEWIPYDKFYDIKYVKKDEFGDVYRANWIDGNISYWDDANQNWKRNNHLDMLVNLKNLNIPNNLTLEFVNEIKIEHEIYGITQDPETKIYMMVLDNKCQMCNKICNTIYFQQNFRNWTSDNNDIDKFIQDTQLSAHDSVKEALEWIPYDRLYEIKCIVKDEFRKMYRANWIGGEIICWDYEKQKWKRNYRSISVILSNLDYSKNITSELMKKINKPCGITQDPETKCYMMVLYSHKCNTCVEICNAIHFQQKFIDWASGNNNIDKFIQETQLSEHTYYRIKNALEWIPYDGFHDIKYVAKGGFGKVYSANWITGCIDEWDNEIQNWRRKDHNKLVALKSLNNSKNVTLDFIREVMLHNKVNDNNFYIIKLYGITQDPETKDYIMVMDYAKDGSLRKYLDTNFNKLNWENKIKYMCCIASGLVNIHKNKLIHRDLHIRNILKNYDVIHITDMGLCKPADYNASENTKNNIYGVLPYIAPEILREQYYTEAADIYSFGIIMYEIISGLPPYHNLSHDNNLAIKICEGLRPMFNIKVPQLIVHLIKRCLDTKPLNRPMAKEIRDELWKWRLGKSTEIQQQIKEADEINNNSLNSIPSTSLSYKTHSEAIYTSRLLNYNNLPEPKNSDDYYEQNDNIISKEFSGIN